MPDLTLGDLLLQLDPERMQQALGPDIGPREPPRPPYDDTQLPLTPQSPRPLYMDNTDNLSAMQTPDGTPVPRVAAPPSMAPNPEEAMRRGLEDTQSWIAKNVKLDPNLPPAPQVFNGAGVNLGTRNARLAAFEKSLPATLERGGVPDPGDLRDWINFGSTGFGTPAGRERTFADLEKASALGGERIKAQAALAAKDTLEEQIAKLTLTQKAAWDRDNPGAPESVRNQVFARIDSNAAPYLYRRGAAGANVPPQPSPPITKTEGTPQEIENLIQDYGKSAYRDPVTGAQMKPPEGSPYDKPKDLGKFFNTIAAVKGEDWLAKNLDRLWPAVGKTWGEDKVNEFLQEREELAPWHFPNESQQGKAALSRAMARRGAQMGTARSFLGVPFTTTYQGEGFGDLLNNIANRIRGVTPAAPPGEAQRLLFGGR